jgi:hypothetical protein
VVAVYHKGWVEGKPIGANILGKGKMGDNTLEYKEKLSTDPITNYIFQPAKMKILL